jgi:eukaryotic-like serine/threonine-protein kinase
MRVRWLWFMGVVAPALVGGCLAVSAPRVMGVAADRPQAAESFTGKRVVEWTGRAVNLRYTRRSAGYYTADEFSFTLDSPANGRWQVVSREPTPFESWRMGTTFTGLKLDWSTNPQVRIVALKGIDRIPATYPGLQLDPEKTLTVLLLDVRTGDAWKPWYINNWFHRWSTPEEDARIAGHYVDRGAPYDVYGFRDDLLADLTEKSKQTAARFPTWRCYHGVLVKDAKAGRGYALELLHLFARNPQTGGYDCVYGDTKQLVPLSTPSPVALAALQEPPGVILAAAEPAAPAPAASGWWMVGGGPEHRGIAPGSLPPPLKLRWETKAGKAFAGGPVAAGGRVYIGNNDGNVYAFEAATGKQVWSAATKAEVEATPAVYNGLVLIGSFDGSLYALDAASGKERWRFATGPRLSGFEGIAEVKQGIDSSVAVVEGRAYFGAWDGKVYCLDAMTGKPIWSRQTEGIVHWSAPAVAGGKVLIGTTDGSLHCLDASTGRPVWAQKLAGRHMDHMMSAPSVADGTVYIGGGYENGFYAVSLADGKVRWRYTAKNLVCSGSAVDESRVYGFADGLGHIFALDRATGREVWARQFGKGWGACNPVLCGKVLYVTMREGSEDGKPVALAALDAASGRTLWTYPDGPAWAGPAVADGMLFFGSDDGKLRAFVPAGG